MNANLIKMTMIGLILGMGSASAYASVPCANEIKAAALDKAQEEGFAEGCMIGQIELTGSTANSREGTIELFCKHHISQISVASEVVSLHFSVEKYDSVMALDCETVSVSDAE